MELSAVSVYQGICRRCFASYLSRQVGSLLLEKQLFGSDLPVVHLLRSGDEQDNVALCFGIGHCDFASW